MGDLMMQIFWALQKSLKRLFKAFNHVSRIEIYNELVVLTFEVLKFGFSWKIC